MGYCRTITRIGRVGLITLVLFTASIGMGPQPAQAIPTAGDYIFTSGLSGTFTSDGSMLTVWHITDPFFRVWSSSDVAPLILDYLTTLFYLAIFLSSDLLLRWAVGCFNAHSRTLMGSGRIIRICSERHHSP